MGGVRKVSSGGVGGLENTVVGWGGVENSSGVGVCV